VGDVDQLAEALRTLRALASSEAALKAGLDIFVEWPEAPSARLVVSAGVRTDELVVEPTTIAEGTDHLSVAQAAFEWVRRALIRRQFLWPSPAAARHDDPSLPLVEAITLIDAGDPAAARQVLQDALRRNEEFAPGQLPDG
jgi:hypothetical protein